MRNTNADVRAYAILSGVTLSDIARRMGISNALLSNRYFYNEQTEETKDYLKCVIDKIAEERKNESLKTV